ncbi:hypothetical protein Tco_0190218 [Tanacetum coccineum]
MVLNSPCFTVKSCLVQDQTVPGKDKSNLLVADSFLIAIWFSIHLVIYNKELAIPEQTTTGKGTSNLLMAGVCVELSILATALNRLERSILNWDLHDLRIEFNKSKFNLATYKRGLTSVEEQLVFYKKNELEKLKQEKESNQLKIEKFNNTSKSLDKLIGSQIPDKSRKGVGFLSYNVVPPPLTRLFSPPNLDLSYSGLEEFQQPKFEGYGPKSRKSVSEDISNEVWKCNTPKLGHNGIWVGGDTS